MKYCQNNPNNPPPEGQTVITPQPQKGTDDKDASGQDSTSSKTEDTTPQTVLVEHQIKTSI